jgi:hypothetical protein
MFVSFASGILKLFCDTGHGVHACNLQLRRLRQEDFESEVSLVHIVRPCLKKCCTMGVQALL